MTFRLVSQLNPVVISGDVTLTGGVAASLTGNTAGTLALISSGTMYLAGGSNITLSQSQNTISIVGGAGGAGVTPALSGSNGSFSFSTATFGNLNGLSFYTSNGSLVGSYTVPSVPAQTEYVFSNSNGVSFGTNGSTVTASHNGITSQSIQTQNLVSVQGSTGNISFSNANGITFGADASTITASHNGLTSQSNQAFSAGGGSSAFQTLSFANGNGVSFTNTNGSVGATVKTDYAASDHSHGNPTLNLTNISGTTASNSNGLTLSLSAAAPGGGGDGYNIIGVNGAGTSASTTLQLSNANNVTFGLNAGTITASASFNQSVQTQNMVSIEGSTGNIDFANANGITFGFNASTITASHNGLTSQSNQAFSAQGGSSTFQTLSFNNANGLSFSNNAGAIQASYTVPTVTNSSLTVQAGGSTLSSVSRMAFGDGNGVSFGASTSNNGSITITASHNGLTSQSNQAFSADGGSSAFQTLNFRNANGLSFSNSNGSVQGSYTVPSVTQYFSATNTTFNGTNVSGSLTLNTNGLRIDLSAGAGGGVTPVASASNGSFSFTTLAFSNANNVTFGTSAGSIITASVAAPGAAAENNWFNLSGNTAGNTTASGSTINLSAINLTLSGTNGSQIAISAPATSSLSATGIVSLSTNGSTISVGAPAPMGGWINEPSVTQLGTAASASVVSVVPLQIPYPLNMSNVRIGASLGPQTTGNNSTNRFNISMSYVLYTRNGSTLSSINSGSNSFFGTYSSNATQSVGGVKELTGNFASSTVLNPGDYWMAMHISTAISAHNTSGTTNNTMAYSMIVGATVGTAALQFEPLGSATTNHRGAYLGQGIISTGNTLGSFALSSVSVTGTRGYAAKLFVNLRNYTLW